MMMINIIMIIFVTTIIINIFLPHFILFIIIIFVTTINGRYKNDNDDYGRYKSDSDEEDEVGKEEEDDDDDIDGINGIDKQYDTHKIYK